MKKIRYFLILILTIFLFYNFFKRFIHITSNESIMQNMEHYSIEKYDLHNFTYETYKFDLLNDLLVFLHIEKTGGTELENKLTNNLTVYNAETKTWISACLRKPEMLIKNKEQIYSKYYCPRGPSVIDSNRFSLSNSWLFSRSTYGWGRLITWSDFKHLYIFMYIIFNRSSLGLQCSFRFWKV